MNARWQDTPAAVFLRLLADLMILNLLVLFCSLGVVTIGAALSAMYAVLFQREWDEGMVAEELHSYTTTILEVTRS